MQELVDIGVQIDTATETLRKAALEKLVTKEPGLVSVINPGSSKTTQVVTAWLPGNFKQVGLVDEQNQPVKILETESAGEQTRIHLHRRGYTRPLRAYLPAGSSTSHSKRCDKTSGYPDRK